VERVSILDLAVGMWTAESQELLRDQPVEISILHFFVVLVFIIVKVVKLKETSFLSLRNSPEAIEDGDGVDADAEACIPERDKRRVKAANEGLEGFLRGLVQVDDGVGSDQKCSVGPFVTVKAGVVHNLLLGQGVRLQLSIHFRTEPIEKGQVEGSKIGIKVFIDELVVDAKVVCVCRTLGLD